MAKQASIKGGYTGSPKASPGGTRTEGSGPVIVTEQKPTLGFERIELGLLSPSFVQGAPAVLAMVQGWKNNYQLTASELNAVRVLLGEVAP